MHGSGSKGSFKDRLLHNFRKRKNSKLLDEEILLEEEELQKKKELEKKEKELQFILIRNYFSEQSITPVVSFNKVPVGDVKRKIIMASQVVLAGMGLVAMGISGGSSIEEAKEESEKDVAENSEEVIVEEKEDEIVKEEIVEDENVEVLDLEMVEEEVPLKSDVVEVEEVIKKEEQGLKRIEKRIDSLDRSLIESAYQTSFSSVLKEHIDSNQIDDNNEVLDSGIAMFGSGVSSGLLSQISFVTSLQDNRLSQLSLFREHSYSFESKVKDNGQEIELKDVKVRERRKRTMKANDLNYQLSAELAKQMQYINGLKERITQADKTNNLDFKLTTTSSLMGNIFKLSMGILTLPLESKKLVSPQLVIGSVLINHALKGLKVNVFGDPNYHVYNEYRNFLNEISAGKNELETVQVLLSDSLDEVRTIREDFKELFQDYMGVSPEYDEAFNRIDKIEQSLQKKQEVLKQMENTLNEEYENNKVKIKKMEA